MTTNDAALEIRTMIAEDVSRVLEIVAGVSNAPHWPESAYRNAANPELAPARVALVAEKAGAVLGFAIASLLAGQAELEIIAVGAESQGQGIGRRLLAELMTRLRRAAVREVFLEVRSSNQRAMRLYRVFGFAVTGRRSRYYVDPMEDGVLMRCSLD